MKIRLSPNIFLESVCAVLQWWQDTRAGGAAAQGGRLNTAGCANYGVGGARGMG